MNRGNARAQVFHERSAYRVFLDSMENACAAIEMRVLAFCLMPNHFHLVLWPHDDGDLSVWMHRLLNAQVQQHRCRYATTGHIWQGRFKAFPIKDDHHLLTVLRYVERNPVRANLVSRAEQWPWSSMRLWVDHRRPGYLCEGPVARPREWRSWVNGCETDTELQRLRHSVHRGAPYGDLAWTKSVAERLGLESSLRSRGRPSQRVTREII